MTINNIIEEEQKKCECLKQLGEMKYSLLGTGENYGCKYSGKCYHQKLYKDIKRSFNLCNYFFNVEKQLKERGKLKC